MRKAAPRRCEMGKIAVLFAGQGAQYPGMGRDICSVSAKAQKVFDMGESITPGIKQICFDSDADILSKTENTQPALFLTDLACAYALLEAGIVGDFAAGFSLGEIAALAYCGILSDSDAYKLVCTRGLLMAKCAEKHPGAMAAVLKLTPDTVEKICSEFKEIYPVNYNCPGQISVAGNAEEMPLFCQRIKETGGRAVPLAVSGAFHSPYMKEASAGLYEALQSVDIKSPKIPLFANISAEPYPDDGNGIVATVANQASSSVRFQTTIEKMHESGADTFIEVGAGKTLSGFVARTLKDVKIFNVSDSDSLNKTIHDLTEN